MPSNDSPSSAHRPVMYWRPGCPFCERLQSDLLDAGIDFAGVNIWDDRDGAATVRAANNGNELVPTVVVGERVLSNPSARQVKAAIREQGA